MNASTSLTCETLLSELPELFIQCLGDRSAPITAVRSPDQAEAGSTIFCSQPKVLTEALSSSAAVLVVPRKFAADTEAKRGDKTILVSPNVERAMAEVIRRWFLGTPYRDPSFSGVHPTATIHSSARLGSDVRVGPHAVIGADVAVGTGVFIGANSVIESGVEIGDESVIHPLVYVGHHVIIGKRCEILPNSTVGKEGFGYAHDERGNHYRIPHQGRVVLEDDVHVGSCCAIDRGTFGETRIGSGTKLDNQVHIAHNCKIGSNGLLTAKFGIAGSSSIGANFVAGGSAMVSGHLHVTDNVQISGLSGVTKSIDEAGQYGGFPLLPLQKSIKARAAIANLPEMRKQLAQLMKKVFPEGSGSADQGDA